VRHEEADWAVVFDSGVSFLSNVTELSLFAQIVWSIGVIYIHHGWFFDCGGLKTFISRCTWDGGIDCISGNIGILVSVSARQRWVCGVLAWSARIWVDGSRG
jgi:hypothetical protein